MTPTIPIPTQHDPTQVEALRPFVAGRHCIVVGSAPLERRTIFTADGLVTIPVNGGISSITGEADVWVLNSKAQDAPGAPMRPLHKVMLEQGRRRSVGHLLMLRGPKVASEQLTRRTLAEMTSTHKTWSVVDKVTKRWIEGELCDRRDDKKPCSSGILTVAMALYAGAASVRLVGFSFAPGYNYLPKERPEKWWRDHVEADKRAIKALSARYGDQLSGDLIREAVAA